MKHVLTPIRQFIRLDSIAYGKTIDTLAEGEVGIYNATDLTPIATANKTLPDLFKIAYKVDNRLFFNLGGPIKKSDISNVKKSPYQPFVPNRIKGAITTYSCDGNVILDINIKDERISTTKGNYHIWKDTYVATIPDSIKAQYGCGKTPTYVNHLITLDLYKQILDAGSPYYTVSIKTDDAAATAFGDVAAVEAFINAQKAVNTDTNDTNDSAKLAIHLEGTTQLNKTFSYYDNAYTYPSGAKLDAHYRAGDTGGTFTELNPITYERGNGADLRYEEFQNMSNYQDLPGNSVIAFEDKVTYYQKDAVFQFRNEGKYNTLTFEYHVPKSEAKGTGDNIPFMICLGVESTAATAAATQTDLDAIFV